MRHSTALLVTLPLAAVVGFGPAPAAATTSSAVSEPNRDIRVLVSLGCSSDRDHDGDANTCGKGDTASVLHAVFNQSDTTQTVRVVATFDAPGTSSDRTTSIDVLLQPDGIYDVSEQFRVQHKKTALGTYTLSVSASGSESAATSAFLAVHG